MLILTHLLCIWLGSILTVAAIALCRSAAGADRPSMLDEFRDTELSGDRQLPPTSI